MLSTCNKLFAFFLLVSLLHATILLAAAETDTCLGCGERVFNKVTRAQVVCNNTESRPDEGCAEEDCFLAAAMGSGSDDSKLRHQEWLSMSQALQDLATQDRLDDFYPEGMRVLPPISELKQRQCPVRYEVLVYRETVPMLIVHARCRTSRTIGTPSMHCKEVQQYRQVYTRLPGCTTADKSRSPVYAKSFVSVAVSCAAYSK